MSALPHSSKVAARPSSGTADGLGARQVSRRLLETAGAALLVLALVLAVPGLGKLRAHLSHAAPGWVAVGVALELLSALSYVVIFRSVFCARMGWRLSYQIGMSEQAANSLLPASGAGGLAVGVWALRRLGMSRERIARRTAAFFLLTSLANVAGVILFAALYPIGILGEDPNPALTYSFGAAALLATVLALALPMVLGRGAISAPQEASTRRLAAGIHFLRHSLAQGIRDGLSLLRRRSIGVIAGSLGTMVFDLAVLGVCFRAFGASPTLGVLVLGYLIGQLGGNLPVPGGLGGIDGGLVGTFALYHQPLATTTAAVLAYHAVSLWIPALLGGAAFVKLRKTLEREHHPAAICAPAPPPVRPVAQPVSAR